MRVNQIICNKCEKEIESTLNTQGNLVSHRGYTVTTSVLPPPPLPTGRKVSRPDRRRRTADYHEDCLPDETRETLNLVDEDDDDEDWRDE